MHQPGHEIRLLAVDLDGTLLDQEGNLGEANVKALLEASRRGIEVVPVSARPVFGMEYGLRAFDLFRYAIAYNGAFVFDRDDQQVLLDLRIEPVQLQEILRLIKEHELYAGYYIGNDFFTEVDGESARLEARFLGRPPARVHNLLEVIWRGANKIIVLELTDLEKLDGFHQEVTHAVQNLSILFSSRFSIEITPGNASKGNGLRFLAERLSVPRETIMAVGDHFNDISMLEYAGLAVAMGNAPPEVSRVADYVVAPCEGCGVAEAVERFIPRPQDGETA